MPKRNGKRPLVPPGEPKQKTDTGLEIPVPKRKDVSGLLDKATSRKDKTQPPKAESRGA
jgi:hypothetical protein